MTHTPGPWTATVCEVEQRDETYKAHWSVTLEDLFADRDQFLICDAFGINQRSNARLIAAAPELLEACKAALDWVNLFALHAPYQFGNEDKIAEVLRAAIAKAEETR